MDGKHITSALWLLFWLPSLALAFDMEKLASLHRLGDASKTYNYATEHLDEMAGDPYFDYYYGVAAINAGYASEGVFALERVLAVTPQNRSARLVLAQGYFTLEEYARARQEFEAVRNSEPGPEAGALIKRYLRAIRDRESRYQTTSVAFAEVGLGHSDNINNAPENQSVGGFTVADPALDDSYLVVAAGYEVGTPISAGTLFFAGGSIDYQSNSDKSRFNSGDVDLRGGFKFFNDLNRYTLQLDVQRYYLNDDVYRKSTSLFGEWRHRSSESRYLNTFARISTYDYPNIEIRDATNITLGVGMAQTVNIASTPVVYGHIFAGLDDADSNTTGARATAERDLGGFQLGLQSNLSSRLRWVNNLGWLSSRYAEERAVGTTNVKRDDQLLRLDSELIYELSQDFSLRGNIGYSQNNSNINVFDYDGVSGEVRVRYELN